MHLRNGDLGMSLRGLQPALLAILVGGLSRPCDAITPEAPSEEQTVLRLNLGAGLTYEFQSLDGVLMTGSGPSAEINLEFVIAKRRSWGFGARYRHLSLLGPDVSAAGATIQKISNIDTTAFARFGWLEIFAGVESFSGDLFVVDSAVPGSQISESRLIPVGGLGVTFYSSKGIRGRMHASGSYGEAYGYSLTSMRVNASMQMNFP